MRSNYFLVNLGKTVSETVENRFVHRSGRRSGAQGRPADRRDERSILAAEKLAAVQ